MTQKTLLNDTHRALGAKMVDFGGWDMPIHYGSQLDEHHLVRREAGVFDVSHMTVVDLRGDQARPFLRRLLANSIDKLKVPGKALYSCMLNPRGGVIDDLIVYYLGDDFFRMVVNASTREKDLAWLREQAAPFGGAQLAPDCVVALARGSDCVVDVLGVAALKMIKDLPVRRIDHWQGFARRAGHRCVGDEVELHPRILRQCSNSYIRGVTERGHPSPRAWGRQPSRTPVGGSCGEVLLQSNKINGPTTKSAFQGAFGRCRGGWAIKGEEGSPGRASTLGAALAVAVVVGPGVDRLFGEAGIHLKSPWMELQRRARGLG